MASTPTRCADDLPSILGIFKKYSKSRSVNNSPQWLDLDPNSRFVFFYQLKLHPARVLDPRNHCMVITLGFQEPNGITKMSVVLN